MCLKIAPYLQQTSVNWTLNKVLFWCFDTNVALFYSSNKSFHTNIVNKIDFKILMKGYNAACQYFVFARLYPNYYVIKAVHVNI